MGGADALRLATFQEQIDRLQEGDPSARAALLAAACDRLTRLAHKMLRDYPVVQRWEQTDDVVQNSLIRLDRALGCVIPPTTEDFFRLAAALIRRELLSLARRYRGPQGIDANHETWGQSLNFDPTDQTHDPEHLSDWTEFHQGVEALDEDDRAVFDLLWYHALTQSEAAHVLGVSERTIRRRWVSARMRLGDTLAGLQAV